VSETPSIDRKAVFVNAPFDSAYEPLFVTLIGMITFLDYNPHCVLEVRETGEGRLQRIYDLMRTCRISIHDMSRIGAPVRFNMPFELGLAVSLKLAEPQEYEVIVLDSVAHRMDRRLSDFKGRDLFIHHGTCDGMIAALLDAFQSQRSDASELRKGARDLRTYARNIKRALRAETIFHPHLFQHLIKAALKIATERGFLLP
jgi:hypothetical protein